MRLLEYLRRCKNLTQAELAVLVGISQPKISQLENGNLSVSVLTLEQIGHYLDYCGTTLKLLDKIEQDKTA